MKKKFVVPLLASILVVTLLVVPASAAYSADDLANQLYSGWSYSGGSSYGSWYSVTLYWLNTLGTRISTLNTSVDNIETDVDTIRSDIATVKTNTNNLSTILTRLTAIDTSLDNIESDVDTVNTNVSTIRTNSNSIVTLLSRTGTLGTDIHNINNLLSLMAPDVSAMELSVDQVEGYLDNIDHHVAALKSFFDNASHRALETASESTVDAATSMFSSSPNGNSTAQNASDLSSFSSNISSALDTGVSADSAFNFLNTDDNVYGDVLPTGRSGSPFAFFSNETLYDLDPRRNMRGADIPEVVDYFSLNRSQFDNLIRGEDDKK